MIVLTNSFIPHFTGPAIKKLIEKKDSLQVAKTITGDSAHYVPYTPKLRQLLKPGVIEDSDDESDEMSDVEGGERGLGCAAIAEYMKARPSFTGNEWVPVFNDRMTVFVSGAPGAGKSYLSKQLIQLFPTTMPILLFTALEENDGNFDELGTDRLYKIKMVPEVLADITLSKIREFAKSPQVILLFDDVDKIRSKAVEKLVFAIMNDALANGRGHTKHDGEGDIHVICTSHSAHDFIKTKYAFENSNYIALFPGSTPALSMYRSFEKLGLEKKLCQKMMRLGRQQEIRSVIIHKVVPMYMIFGNKIMML